MSWTLSDARVFLVDNNRGDASAKAYRQYDKIANAARHEMARLGKWSFDKRFSTLVFAAQNTTGTIAVTQNSGAVVGVATTFAAGDVGKMLRVGGDETTYRVLTYISPTQITIETYLGSGGSGLSFAVTNERVTLPARFRSFMRPILQDGSWMLRPAPDLRDVKRLRRYERALGIPQIYAVEQQEIGGGSTVPQPFMWVYPAPDIQYILEIGYYVWPQKAALTTDDFGLPDVAAAESAHQELMLAYLEREKGNVDTAGMRMQTARDFVDDALAGFKELDEGSIREEYVDDDEQMYMQRSRLGPGEPLFP